MTCSIPIRTGASTCTTASSTRATRISRSSPCTLGAKPLVETAGRLGISLTVTRSSRRVPTRSRRSATARRMSSRRRCAWRAWLRPIAETASCARRDEDQSAAPAKTEVVLQPDAARPRRFHARGGADRDRPHRLRDHPWRIAGKTGTAELGGQTVAHLVRGLCARTAPPSSTSRSPSSSRTPDTAAPAPAAGEIVTAAAAAGLVRDAATNVSAGLDVRPHDGPGARPSTLLGTP